MPRLYVQYYCMFCKVEHGGIMKNKDESYLQEAIKLLKREVEYLDIKIRKKKNSFLVSSIYDTELEINYKNKINSFYVIIKKNFSIETLRYLLINETINRKQKKNILLISENLSKPIIKDLKKGKINFIDLNGNIFINIEPIYLFIHERKNISRRRKKPNAIFYPAGLKLLFLFFNIPESVNYPIRSLANYTKTSIGSISNNIKSLEELGYLIKYDEYNRILIKQEDLFLRWITAYLEKLRPKLLRGKYSLLNNKKFHQGISLKKWDTFFSGELGAEVLDLNIKAENIIIYSNEEKIKIMKEFQLIPDLNGKVEILDIFWDDILIREKSKFKLNTLNLAPLLLIYTDLLISDSSRILNITKDIYERYIKDKFRRHY